MKTAGPGRCVGPLPASLTAEYIANAEAQRVQEAVKKIRPSKKDLRHLGKGNLAGLMVGKGILEETQERDKQDRGSSKEGKEGNSHKEARPRARARHTCPGPNPPLSPPSAHGRPNKDPAPSNLLRPSAQPRPTSTHCQ